MSNEDFAKNFWLRIDSQLSRTGSSLVFMANKTNVDYDVLRQWRSKNRIPNFRALVEMAKFLNVSTDYLLTGGIIAKTEIDKDIEAVQNNPIVRKLVHSCVENPDIVPLIPRVIKIFA